MLLGQDFGGGHDGRLEAVGDGLERRSGGHGGFATPHIALEQTGHWYGGAHIGKNLG